MIIKSDKIITPGGVISGCVVTREGSIVEVTERSLSGEVLDLTGKFVSPGFIDLHVHGGAGCDFGDATQDEVVKACSLHLSHGTTSLLPTVSAARFADMERAVENIAKAKSGGECAANIIGAHLEGPYLSTEQCGAQCADFITAPKKAEYLPFLEKWGDAVARWTYAPELDDGSFCKELSRRGILPSAGHTAATYEDVRRAMDHGMRLITHLYSCTSTVTRRNGFRSLGVIESAFLRDELFVEIIADGKHLPPELIEMIIKIKGVERTALITDALPVTGTLDKEGVMSGTHFVVEDGVCKLSDRSAFAGSIATSDKLVRVLTKEAGESLENAVKMLTEVPARILGVKKGRPESGYDADIIAFDDDITIASVIVGGKQVK